MGRGHLFHLPTRPILSLLWTEFCPPPQLQQILVASLTLHVNVFRDGAFKEVLKVKRGHKGGALIQLDLIRRDPRGLRTERGRPRQTQREDGQLQAKASSETSPAGALILGFQHPEP